MTFGATENKVINAGTPPTDPHTMPAPDESTKYPAQKDLAILVRNEQKEGLVRGMSLGLYG